MKVEDFIRVNVPELIEVWRDNASDNYTALLSLTDNVEHWTVREKSLLERSYFLYEAALFIEAARRVKEEHSVRISYGRFYHSLVKQLEVYVDVSGDEMGKALNIAQGLWQANPAPVAMRLLEYWLEIDRADNNELDRFMNSPVTIMGMNAPAPAIFDKNYGLFSTLSEKLQ